MYNIIGSVYRGPPDAYVRRAALFVYEEEGDYDGD